MEETSISPGKIPLKRLTKTYAQHYWLQKKTWTGIPEKLSKRVMHNATAFRKKVWTTTSEELWTQKRSSPYPKVTLVPLATCERHSDHSKPLDTKRLRKQVYILLENKHKSGYYKKKLIHGKRGKAYKGLEDLRDLPSRDLLCSTRTFSCFPRARPQPQTNQENGTPSVNLILFRNMFRRLWNT